MRARLQYNIMSLGAQSFVGGVLIACADCAIASKEEICGGDAEQRKRKIYVLCVAICDLIIVQVTPPLFSPQSTAWFSPNTKHTPLKNWQWRAETKSKMCQRAPGYIMPNKAACFLAVTCAFLSSDAAWEFMTADALRITLLLYNFASLVYGYVDRRNFASIKLLSNV